MTQPTPPTLLCCCLRLTQQDVDEVILAGATSADEVANACGAGTGCGSCRPEITQRCRTLATNTTGDS